MKEDLILYYHSNEIITNLISYSISGSMGQIFSFQILEKYGPLTLSIITGVRKILSIGLSIIYFGKVVSIIKIISLCLGTSVICWEIFEERSKPKHQNSQMKKN